MAERILKNRLKHTRTHGVEVSSAGLLVDMHGAPADMMAKQILRENGIEDEGHHSQVINEAMIGEADLIVTMEKKQMQIIGDQYPFAVNKLKLLTSYVQRSDIDSTDIKDPYKQSIFHYRLCFAEISLAVEELMKCI